MFIYLKTSEIWECGGVSSPENFFSALEFLLNDGDFLVIGSYCQTPAERQWLENNCIPRACVDGIYNARCFHVNREEYPQGNDFVFLYDKMLVNNLAELAKSYINDPFSIFIDHIVAYRKCGITIPLINFMRSFRTGTIELSGLYSEDQVIVFCDAIHTNYESTSR